MRSRRAVPSTFFSISQPIEDRTNEMISGSRADVQIMLTGTDLLELKRVSEAIRDAVRGIEGTGDVRVERVLGMPELTVKPDRARLARYGVRMEDALLAIEAARVGMPIGWVYEGQRRFETRLLVPPRAPVPEALGDLFVETVDGHRVPLSEVATITESEGPAQIRRENRVRIVRVEVNLRGRDLLSWVTEAQQAVAAKVALPTGYAIQWSGQFENFERASKRLAVVVPIALALIFGMLLWNFGDVRYAVAVFAVVPFALTGGMVGLILRDMEFSIPAAVGFIALAGVAVLNGVILATDVRHALDEGHPFNEAVVKGSVHTMRAVLTTGAVAALGFLPMALATGAGSEVQRPLATTVVFGIGASTLMTMFLLPAILKIILRREQREDRGSQPEADELALRECPRPAPFVRARRVRVDPAPCFRNPKICAKTTFVWCCAVVLALVSPALPVTRPPRRRRCRRPAPRRPARPRRPPPGVLQPGDHSVARVDAGPRAAAVDPARVSSSAPASRQTPPPRPRPSPSTRPPVTRPRTTNRSPPPTPTRRASTSTAAARSPSASARAAASTPWSSATPPATAAATATSSTTPAASPRGCAPSATPSAGREGQPAVLHPPRHRADVPPRRHRHEARLPRRRQRPRRLPPRRVPRHAGPRQLLRRRRDQRPLRRLRQGQPRRALPPRRRHPEGNYGLFPLGVGVGLRAAIRPNVTLLVGPKVDAVLGVQGIGGWSRMTQLAPGVDLVLQARTKRDTYVSLLATADVTALGRTYGGQRIFGRTTLDVGVPMTPGLRMSLLATYTGWRATATPNSSQFAPEGQTWGAHTFLFGVGIGL
jgi:hypothetical protein